ncbi:sigma-70 family RNA polymerase sigma factor [Frankia sp. AgB32]|uniref:sigma-70 family RNA polymerase sigma factor n=1 Tax=Frankia sp. AgB32 TaxID=631119 RepID=UPI0024B07CFB
MLARRFEEHRAHLHAVAVRMLGSAHEADDAVQDAWLRLDRADAEDVANLGGWLTTVLARVCLNRLRARRSRPEEPVGVHVPDPVVLPHGVAGPEEQALLADSVGAALFVVLDTLAPAERLAFVLHDLFGLPFDEIGPTLDRTPAAARQLASRARRRVRGGQSPPDDTTTGAAGREIVAAFFAAARGGRFDELVTLLHPDVVLRADGGPARAPATAVVRGAAAVARRAMMFAQPAAQVHPMLVNGTAGVVITVGGQPVSVMAFETSGGRVTAIQALVDPTRLGRLHLPDLAPAVEGEAG